MNTEFPRIITLLRKEKKISQKNAAAELGISQALLSHYEKGIRECGLDFLVRCANFYGVSCDYLLGRSPLREGHTLQVEDIPNPEDGGKENQMRGASSILPTLNKKLISNSLNILFDFIQKSGNKTIINDTSNFLMLAVYRMFRVIYSAGDGNIDAMFSYPNVVASHYASAAMDLAEARLSASVAGQKLPGVEIVKDSSCFDMDTTTLAKDYPLFASSLLNLIKNAEASMKSKK